VDKEQQAFTTAVIGQVQASTDLALKERRSMILSILKG
jgi:hypothetical protein